MAKTLAMGVHGPLIHQKEPSDMSKKQPNTHTNILNQYFTKIEDFSLN